MPHNPAIVSSGATPIIETRRGMRGAMLHGLWIPLPVIGGAPDGDGEGDPPPAPKPADQPPPPANDGDQIASREATETIRKLREQLKDQTMLTKERDALKAKLDEIEASQLSESEKVTKERDALKASLDEAEKKSRDRVIRSEVRVLASELNFADPADAYVMLDLSAVEFDDAGEPKDLKPLLEKLAKDKPYLLKATDGKTAVPPTAKGGNGQLSRDELIEQKKKALLAARV